MERALPSVGYLVPCAENPPCLIFFTRPSEGAGVVNKEFLFFVMSLRRKHISSAGLYEEDWLPRKIRVFRRFDVCRRVDDPFECGELTSL